MPNYQFRVSSALVLFADLHRVHYHPSDQRRCCAFVKSTEPFLANGLHDTIQRPSEATVFACLHSDFDGIESGSSYYLLVILMTPNDKKNVRMADYTFTIAISLD